MIERIIALSLQHRFFILVAALFIALSSLWSMKQTPLDALPDLSPAQVIVQIKWSGQSPQTIEQQGTYAVVSKCLGVANIETVRAISTYENALIYIIFKEGTDLYFARSRVLEQLAALQPSLPASMQVSLGPDASGVGWVYEYALHSKTLNLGQLRTLQDYYYKYALMGVDGVSDVASIGGFIPTFQVTINSDALIRYQLSINDIATVLRENNNETGGRIVIQNGYEWMVQANGYVKSLDDIRQLVITNPSGIAITLGDIAHIERVAAPRRGLAELDGNGEVVGGIVMVRYGEDVYGTIKRIKAKMQALALDDVDVTTVYDRSSLIDGALHTLKQTLMEESLIVILIIALFLLHLRSSLIVLIILPLTVGMTFLFMHMASIGSNIMSLGGIAIAIGAMVDATIVMIENAHKMLHAFHLTQQRLPTFTERYHIILHASQKVGRPIFFALSIIIISFLPIFALNAQEGLLFTPLAFTKTFAMASGALLSITLVPVLMLFFIRGRLLDARKNPINRLFTWLYKKLLDAAMSIKYLLLLLLLGVLGWMVPLYMQLPWEFMPALNERSVMYMPVTPYGISIDQAKALTQKTDAIIKSFPEVEHVFGKAGHADTATDPAPLGMLESIITFKPQQEWRDGVTYESLQKELDAALQIKGLSNAWTYPIRGRIDMLLSGIRTPIGIKLYGTDEKKLQQYAQQIERALQQFEWTESVFADEANSGYYINVNIDEAALQRYNLKKSQLLETVALGIGGGRVTIVYDGLARYDITLRLEETQRTSLEAIQEIPIKTKLGFMPLKAFASVTFEERASVIKSEMATPVTYIYITPKAGIDAHAYVEQAQQRLKNIALEPGYYMQFAGQSRYLEEALNTMLWIIPAVIALTFVLIVMALRSFARALIVFFTLPFALFGGLLYIYWLHFSFSIAVIVGFLALLGVAAETAIVMMIYLQEAYNEARARKQHALNAAELKAAIYEGAVQRLRPKLMTVFAICASLTPIMYATGIGSEVMQRIAAPMLGGIVSSAVLSLVIIPILYEIYMQRRLTHDTEF